MNECSVRKLDTRDRDIEAQVRYWNKWRRGEPRVLTKLPVTNLLREKDFISPQERYFKRFGISSGNSWKVETRAEAIEAAFDLPSEARVDPDAIGFDELTPEERLRGSIPLTFETFTRMISSSFKKNIELLEKMNAGEEYSVVPKEPEESEVREPGSALSPPSEDLKQEDGLEPDEVKTATTIAAVDKLASEELDEKSVQNSAEVISASMKDLFSDLVEPEDFSLKKRYKFDELRGEANNDTLSDVLKYLAVNSVDFARPVRYIRANRQGIFEDAGFRNLTTLLNDIRRADYGEFELDLMKFTEFRPIDWER